MTALQERSEVRDGMRSDWNVPITMDGGLVLRADIFSPRERRDMPGHCCAPRTASSTRSCLCPYHTHDQKQPLKKGQQVELDIEIWPT